MRTHARYRHTALVALAGLVLLASAGTSARPFPDFIPLPADFGPEGIAVGNGSTFYAGSLAAATRGQILVGDLRTGETATLVPAEEVPATGMKTTRGATCSSSRVPPAAWGRSSMPRPGTSWPRTSFTQPRPSSTTW